MPVGPGGARDKGDSPVTLLMQQRDALRDENIALRNQLEQAQRENRALKDKTLFK